MPDEHAGTLPEGAAMPKVLRSKTRAVRVVEDCQAANLDFFELCTIDNMIISKEIPKII